MDHGEAEGVLRAAARLGRARLAGAPEAGSKLVPAEELLILVLAAETLLERIEADRLPEGMRALKKLLWSFRGF